jgi:hypothetical protein
VSKGKQLKGQLTGDHDVLSREEALRLLSEMAKNGSVTAAVALERALRLDPGKEDEDELDAELDRLLRRDD